MADATLRLPRARNGFPLSPLRAAADRAGELVHLISVMEGVPAQQALCGTPVSAQAPEGFLVTNGCHLCAAMGLERGTSFAEDKHGALVNLRRVLRR